MIDIDHLKLILIAVTALVVFLNLSKIYLILLELAYFIIYKVDFWTYVLFGTLFLVIMFFAFKRYYFYEEEITRLSSVDFFSEPEIDKLKTEAVKKNFSKQVRASKYPDVKRRLEKDPKNKNIISPPMSGDENDSIIKE